ncbi:DUF3769 domain-containing protein [Synechococcus elongatus IITB5]|uniref:DUF3769 domain-containing protein n=1 Tax=Synechococcus elongatus TaxID=32046 RepID=UPI0030CF4BAC
MLDSLPPTSVVAEIVAPTERVEQAIAQSPASASPAAPGSVLPPSQDASPPPARPSLRLPAPTPAASPTDPVTTPTTAPQPQAETAPALPNLESLGIVRLQADRQSFDGERQLVIAQGRASLRFRGGVLFADEIQVNLQANTLKAEGRVWLLRGQQVARGSQLTYNLLQESGTLLNAQGRFNTGPTGARDLDPSIPPSTDIADRIQSVEELEQPVTNVRRIGQLLVTSAFGGEYTDPSDLQSLTNPGAVLPTQISGFDIRGGVQNVRFQADRLDLGPDGWTAKDIALTNDPFAPPQAEIRSAQATYQAPPGSLGSLGIFGSGLVLENSLRIPLPDNNSVVQEREGGILTVGFDGVDRNGAFLEREFSVINENNIQLSLTPQFLLQRAINLAGGGRELGNDVEVNSVNPLDAFGLVGRLNANIAPNTQFSLITNLASLNPENLGTQSRISSDLRQDFGFFDLLLNYRYRERRFNGSLGVQTVQQSYGVTLETRRLNLLALAGVNPSDTFPRIDGLNFRFQASYQNLLALTDQPNLLGAQPSPALANLNRFQLETGLTLPITLWREDPLPATPDAGLRYTSAPVTPGLRIIPEITGVITNYSDGTSQNSLAYRFGADLTLGKFAGDFFDYTNLRADYLRSTGQGFSPFLFDRLVDRNVLVLGATQQLLGPFLVGVTSAINLDTNEAFNTTYRLEYSRRAFGVSLSYNPNQQVGILAIQLNDFDWQGLGGQN